MENRFDILTSVDVLNTLHGGTVEPQVLLIQREDSRELHINVPSIDPTSIEVTSHGEAALLVSTADDTYEPKNRRVEITIR